VDGISVKPHVAALSPAVAILRTHAADPTVAALLKTLTAAASGPPQPVYELRYSQTPTSVAKDAADARSRAGRMHVATVVLPRALGATGAALLVVLAVLIWRDHRDPAPHPAEATGLPVPGRRRAA
jgi:hypothetical protein